MPAMHPYYFILQVPDEYRRLPPGLPPRDRQSYSAALRSVEDTALFLKPGQSAQLSRWEQKLASF